MHKSIFVFTLAALSLTTLHATEWAAPKAIAIPEAEGYVAIPNPAVAPDKTHVYKTVYDLAQPMMKSAQELLMGLNFVGADLNALAFFGVPAGNIAFAVVFRGPAVDALLNDAAYKKKFNVPNPNLKLIAALKKAGVELFACGQTLAFTKTDPATLTPDVKVATSSHIVLMTYQNKGYALLSF